MGFFLVKDTERFNVLFDFGNILFMKMWKYFSLKYINDIITFNLSIEEAGFSVILLNIRTFFSFFNQFE